MKIILEALDGLVITERTGKSKVNAEMTVYPTEGGYQSFYYDNETCESPGVMLETNGIERLGNQIKLFDSKARPFMITMVDCEKI